MINGVKKRKLKPSEMLEIEAKRKEEQLIELRKAMQRERQLKMKNQSKNGNHWRSATNKKKLFGYSDMVLDHYSKESTTDGSNLPSSQSNRSKASNKAKNRSQKENITQGLQLNKAPKAKNNSIVSNFEKAIAEQNSENDEVGHFLGQIKMEKYKEVFIDNGIEDRETILELNESHLQELGLPLGHKLKIMKRIKEWKKQQDDIQPVQTQPQPQPQKVSSGTETNMNSNSLLDGVYDEEANKAEFQQALNAWRNAGKNNEDTVSNASSAHSKSQASKSKKTVRFAEEPPEEVLILDENPDQESKEDNVATEIKSSRKPTTGITEGMIAFKGVEMSNKSFLFSEEASGSALWNIDLMSTVDHAGTSPRESIIEAPPSVEPEDKEIWWQWYKYVAKSKIEYDKLTGKSFWGIRCQANYFSKNVETWSNSDCQQYFVKKSGIIINHNWYWSTECSSKGYELQNRPEPEIEEQQNDNHDLEVEDLVDENINYEVDLS